MQNQVIQEKAKKKAPVFEIEFIENEKKLTAEALIMGLFGISKTQLIKEIQQNKDGKYNELYSS